MKYALSTAFAVLILASSAAPAEERKEVEVTPETTRSAPAPRSWLGLAVAKPDQTITAHLPALPPGMGFVVRSVQKDGPAELAGFQEFDVLWKIGDQMLVNEGQLAALLRLFQPGDEVVFSAFRAGKPLELKLKLGDSLLTERTFPPDLVDSAILPREVSGPVRVVNVFEKLASYSTDKGRAEVRRDGDCHQVKICGAQGEMIYEGLIPCGGDLQPVPEDWRRYVQVLRRGLDHALESRVAAEIQPRPQVASPPEIKP